MAESVYKIIEVVGIYKHGILGESRCGSRRSRGQDTA